MTTTVYRNYLIAKVGDVYVAQSEDDDCYMISKDERRLNDAIDEIWTALDLGREPSWFSGSSAIDLDHVAIEAEVPSRHSVPVKPLLIGAPPSRISHKYFFMSAFLVASALAFIGDVCVPAAADDLMTVGVCATAVLFGRPYALVMAVASAVAYNFFLIEPIYQLTIPSGSEIFYACVNVGAACGIPELIKRQEQIRAWLARFRSGRT
jgi:K+-sensing histidine kinase KdpD